VRYNLDADGYIKAVSFGCYLDNCQEYNGTVPVGYSTLVEWSDNAFIQAYYINKGNLTLDSERLTKLQQKAEQEAKDNTPVLRKDLYGSEEVLDSQYLRQTKTGKVIVLEDIKTVTPRVKITGIQPYYYDKLAIYTQGKNMMPCDAVSGVVSGVTFTKNASGSLTVIGMATDDIEYIISDGKDTPIFALKKDHNYYLNLGDLPCELRYFNGETTAQQYVGPSGLINLPQNTEVTQVIIKIASGTMVNKTFYPQLEYGESFSSYEKYKCKSLELDIGEFTGELVLPSDTLYAEDTLYPGMKYKTIDYILIEKGVVTISVDGLAHTLGYGNIGLYSTYNTIYSTKDVTLEVEYSSNIIDVDSLAFLQGKATTTNKFKILEDGSIEAHNGYFSGTINGGTININNRFKVDAQGNVTLPDNATISWGQVTGTGNIATHGYVTGQGYQNASQVTQITKNTVTSQYIDATVGLSAKFAEVNNLISDKASITALNSQIARINAIESTYITAHSVATNYATIGSLNSAIARIGYLEGDYVSTDVLDSQIARIDTIEGNYITASAVASTYATHSYVKSKSAEIVEAEIDSLLNGSMQVYGFLGIIGSFAFKNRNIKWSDPINGVRYLIEDD